MARAFAIVLSAAVLWTATAGPGFTLDMDTVNRAELAGKPAKTAKGIDPVIVKAQVLLDLARFSPGEIDGKIGENVKKAITALQEAEGLKADGQLNAETWEVLTANAGESVLVEYTVSGEDLKGPFVNELPSRMEEMKDLQHLGYRTPLEGLAEKFHMSETLVKALNPGKRFDAGETIVVANVRAAMARAKVDRIEIDKSRKRLTAFGKDGQALAVYPATIGSAEKPAPSGTLKITAIARNPTYTYNPEYAFKGVKAKEPFTIRPGPNNPVGSVWIDLSTDGYGIHGTPEPSKVSKTASNGCIRLTNWDAEDLAAMVGKGVPVVFLEAGAEAAGSTRDDTSGSARSRRESTGSRSR